MAKGVNISLRIDPEIKEQFQKEIEARGEKMTVLIQNFMENYIKIAQNVKR